MTARRELGLRPDDLMVGNVARMVRCKDQETLIRAMAAVCQHVPEARLVIVGGGPLREHLQSIEEEVGLYGRVVLTGEVPRERVYEILHALDIFVMSSMAGEGFCNAMVEAMAAGKPVIATRAAALPEVVDGVGRLVPPRSPEALAGEILKLAGLSPEERLSIGRACRKRAEECFSIERTARAYSDLYSHLLARKGR